MALKIVRRYDANGNVIEDKDLERFRLDSPVVRQILYQMNKEMGAVDNIKVDASEKEISTALTSNEKTKAIIKNEKNICQLLTDKGYKECFCEIDGGHMKVVVKLKDATSKDANKIIKLIHNKYNGYIIEVKFVED